MVASDYRLSGEWRLTSDQCGYWIAEYCIVQSAFGNHGNLQSVISYPYPIRIRGIVKNDIRIDLYPQKFSDIRKLARVES